MIDKIIELLKNPTDAIHLIWVGAVLYVKKIFTDNKTEHEVMKEELKKHDERIQEIKNMSDTQEIHLCYIKKGIDEIKEELKNNRG